MLNFSWHWYSCRFAMTMRKHVDTLSKMLTWTWDTTTTTMLWNSVKVLLLATRSITRLISKMLNSQAETAGYSPHLLTQGECHYWCCWLFPLCSSILIPFYSCTGHVTRVAIPKNKKQAKEPAKMHCECLIISKYQDSQFQRELKPCVKTFLETRFKHVTVYTSLAEIPCQTAN